MNNIQKNRWKDQVFKFWGIFCTVIGLVLLTIFIGDILIDGIRRIDWDFITDLPSRKAENSGIYTALMGSIWILALTTIIAFPVGVAAGIYLEEYAKNNKLAGLLEINISNLAGVPSIIYGLLGLEVFVRIMNLGASVLAGSLTLSLLILPIVIVSTREAIKAVPQSIKDASFALGASKWQTIWHQILPASGGGILTGVILALSRAVGETAPLIVVGALAYVPFVPQSPMDEFSVMPIQIFNWISRPQAGFIENAAAAIIILLGITFIMNGIAVYFRNKWQKKWK
ncbi:phosphate ABC transporter membrane protein 2, PhoT family (TC 3.A.1.7.1) [Arenibacter nanhaiticus]|uniref:Phosphate transport system permease protein PstA n=1 Tax=Arenibacter nanhaiticus TaxID=558155 RepID=A0A1M6AHE8_9FLAO|nr:phosphate ABC transporter permease PstA [Arenibacter nanhaiticus]SHI35895.1 phosphate ABC transporter membrane protein 2, PhoT family (TC 3.A.1.7.1) [Arenibacter nanhaiticus]